MALTMRELRGLGAVDLPSPLDSPPPTLPSVQLVVPPTRSLASRFLEQDLKRAQEKRAAQAAADAAAAAAAAAVAAKVSQAPASAPVPPHAPGPPWGKIAAGVAAAGALGWWWNHRRRGGRS